MFCYNTKEDIKQSILKDIRERIIMSISPNREFRQYASYPRQPDPADIMISHVNNGFVVSHKTPYIVGEESSDMVYGVYFGTTGKKQLFCISKKYIGQFCHVEHRIMWIV